MFTTFGVITKTFIKDTLEKINTSVLALIFFYGTRYDKKDYRVLSFFIYTKIKNYVCIDYLACQSKHLSETPVGSWGVSKNVGKCFDKILGIGIPYLLMNLMSCNGFLNYISSVVVLKFPKRMLEYYFSKGFDILKFNVNNLEKLQMK